LTDLTLELLREELAPIEQRLGAIEARLVPIEARLDGLPIMNRRLVGVEQNLRMLKSAFNDFALTNPTTGEIQALHEDVNRVQADYSELATRLTTVERLLEQGAKP
jgi:hypothetical protein